MRFLEGWNSSHPRLDTKHNRNSRNWPPGVAPEDNEMGWRLVLAKLARLVESD